MWVRAIDLRVSVGVVDVSASVQCLNGLDWVMEEKTAAVVTVTMDKWHLVPKSLLHFPFNESFCWIRPHHIMYTQREAYVQKGIIPLLYSESTEILEYAHYAETPHFRVTSIMLLIDDCGAHLNNFMYCWVVWGLPLRDLFFFFFSKFYSLY